MLGVFREFSNWDWIERESGSHECVELMAEGGNEEEKAVDLWWLHVQTHLLKYPLHYRLDVE